VAGLITVAELTARPGFEDLDSGQATALIADASALVREAADPELDAVESPDTPPVVVAVMVNMIRRGLDNPRGNAQETLGDYSYTAGATGGVATLYLTRRERRLVRRAAGKLGAGALSMTGDLPIQPSELSIGLTEDDVL
jgi:hypothetical protein